MKVEIDEFSKLNYRIEILIKELQSMTLDRDTLARANRDLQTQLNAVKECFETVVEKLTNAKGSY